ncbi:AAA family ATPase [Fulvivirga sp. M361]|uniref:AAA family ATPase n=1 Tax=Fulvivirga sp. M361 TaxID=2594266 RepID=UPI00117B7DBF|nr:AAA family ATPase [Fulvivirga sp. M361]TRX51742.1 AAA family ATPase [Fulvivirga sp. M361]
MNISRVRIDNYRGIKEAHFFPSPLTCVIGENNAGKSTILVAVSLFFSGSTISKSDYYNIENEVYIELEFTDISDEDLLRLSPEHKPRIEEIIIDGRLTLVRLYDQDGKSKLYCKKLGPKDSRLSEDNINNLLKGKKGADISSNLITLLPEYESQLNDLKTQKAAKEKIESIVNNLTSDDLEMQITNLPTGIENSITNFLPEPIYIAAVKDLKDDVKTKESTTFGKLLGILLRFLENTKEFEEISNSFERLHGLLNIVETDEGISDDRIQQIITIERQMENYLKENFPKVQVEISVPKPELKQVFSNSKIFIDDGVKDTIDTKGDGIKRALTFSLLRTYVDQLKEHKKQKFEEKNEGETLEVNSQPYIFLFEEPELYLHPNAQKILFEALESLSNEQNQVFVTTHSPLFFSANSTGSFIKVKKEYPIDGKPYGKLIAVNLERDLAYKDAFQILCYENCTPAFFANKVLLVEGDSDLIYLKELASTLNPNWNFDNHNIPIIRMSGKSNLKRYTNFYEHFEVQVYSLVDLDMLIDGFDKYSVAEEILLKREELLSKLDHIAESNEFEADLKKSKIKELTRRYTWKEKYERLKQLAECVKEGHTLSENDKSDIDYLFAEESNNLRRQVLGYSEGDLDLKHELLRDLREINIFILSKGVIEDYYPSEVTGDDKPTKALSAVNLIKEMDDLTFLPKTRIDNNEVCELSEIFRQIFK